MASALSSHPFLLVTVTGSLHSKSEARTMRPSVTVHARQNVFGFGKPKADPLEGETEAENSNKRKPLFVDYVADAKSLIPVVSTPPMALFAGFQRKDTNTVFVAGATGQAGTRIVQMLLRQGFAVRAGVPDLASAQKLARVAATYKVISTAESKRLNAVESTFSDPDRRHHRRRPPPRPRRPARRLIPRGSHLRLPTRIPRIRAVHLQRPRRHHLLLLQPLLRLPEPLSGRVSR